MKKLLAILLSIVTLFSLTACGGNNNDDKASVSLKYYADGGTMIPALINNTINVGLIAEPAASTLIQRSNGAYSIQLDVQTLYGGSYPQAVVVARKSVVDSDSEFINNFTSALVENATWITASDDNAKAAVTAINSSEVSSVQAPTLKPEIITKDIVARCNVNFRWASEMKTSVNNYIASVREVEEKAANTLNDEFFYTAPTSTTKNEQGEYRIVAPDGAPALALGKLIVDNANFNRSVTYNVISASKLAENVTTNKADVLIMPLTGASKLVGTGAEYVMLGVVTHGNLFIVSNSKITSLKDLDSKTIGVIGQGQVPDLTLKILLKQNNISYQIAE